MELFTHIRDRQPVFYSFWLEKRDHAAASIRIDAEHVHTTSDRACTHVPQAKIGIKYADNNLR